MRLRQHRPIFAISLKLLSVLLLSGMGAGVKYLSKALPIGELIFARSGMGVAVVALVACCMGESKWLITRNWRAHFLRSGCGTLSMFAWFMALGHAKIADVTAILFVTPIFATVLAIPLLGERIHVYRWTAVALGFIGVFIMMAPRMSFADSESWGLLLSLVSALLGAFSMIFLRFMSDAEHPVTTTFYFMLASAIGGLCTLPWGWAMPTPHEWYVLILIGIVGIAGQFLLTASFRYAEASIVMPLEYSGMITSVLFGYFIFDELPGRSIWIGAPLVIAAGLLILWREYQLHHARARKSV